MVIRKLPDVFMPRHVHLSESVRSISICDHISHHHISYIARKHCYQELLLVVKTETSLRMVFHQLYDQSDS